MFRWFKRKNPSRDEIQNGTEIDKVRVFSEQEKMKKIEQINATQNIGTVTSIDEMVDRKHDLDFQLGLCNDMMSRGQILPFPFERAVILLSKQKRHKEELSLCRYIEVWCKQAEADYDGWSAMNWKSPRLVRCRQRIGKIEKKLKDP